MTVTEGDAGTSTATSLSPSRRPAAAVTVDYATADGTAAAPATTSRERDAHLRPGETTQTVTVHVNGDPLDEANETFIVNLTNPPNATIATPRASARSPTTTPRRRSRSTT